MRIHHFLLTQYQKCGSHNVGQVQSFFLEILQHVFALKHATPLYSATRSQTNAPQLAHHLYTEQIRLQENASQNVPKVFLEVCWVFAKMDVTMDIKIQILEDVLMFVLIFTLELYKGDLVSVCNFVPMGSMVMMGIGYVKLTVRLCFLTLGPKNVSLRALLRLQIHQLIVVWKLAHLLCIHMLTQLQTNVSNNVPHKCMEIKGNVYMTVLKASMRKGIFVCSSVRIREGSSILGMQAEGLVLLGVLWGGMPIMAVSCVLRCVVVGLPIMEPGFVLIRVHKARIFMAMKLLTNV